MTPTIFLSTGRAGTKWLYFSLSNSYPEATVHHQPISPHAGKGKLYEIFGTGNDEASKFGNIGRLLHKASEAKEPWIWCGHDSIACLPLFIDKLNAKVVHLEREREECIASLQRANFFGSNVKEQVHPNPSFGDALTSKKVSEEEWFSWSQEKRCNFHYDERRAYAALLKNRLGSRFMRLQSESIFERNREALQELISFMGLPWREAFYQRSKFKLKDGFRPEEKTL